MEFDFTFPELDAEIVITGYTPEERATRTNPGCGESFEFEGWFVRQEIVTVWKKNSEGEAIRTMQKVKQKICRIPEELINAFYAELVSAAKGE